MSWLYGSWIQALLQVLRAWKGMWIHHLIEYMLHSNILKPRADISTWKFKIIFNFQVLLSTLGFSILYFQASLAINFYIFLYHCDSSVPYVNKSIILLFIWTVFFFFHFDFSCDVPDARVLVLWKEWRNASSARSVMVWDLKGKGPHPMSNNKKFSVAYQRRWKEHFWCFTCLVSKKVKEIN